MAFRHSTLWTTWGTALARRGQRGPEAQDAGKQGIFGVDAALRMGAELGWAQGVVKRLPRHGAASHPLHFPLPPLERSTVWGAGQGFPGRSERRMI